MKFIVATIAALFAATAFAQTPAAPAKKEEAKPAAAPVAKKEEAKKCDPAKDKDCKAEKKAEPAKK